MEKSVLEANPPRILTKQRLRKTEDHQSKPNTKRRKRGSCGVDTSEVSPTNGTNIQCLPDEILIKILTDLPLRDRKNARSVCERWCRLNNDREISKREKFHFHGHSDLNVGDILKIIENSERSILNLEFVHLDFRIDPTQSLKFWKDYGSRIESLSFRNCKLLDQTLEYVIKYCDKIRDLKFYYPGSMWPCEQGQELISEFALEEFIVLNIRRPSLCSFKLRANDADEGWISNNCLRVLFDIYPNIEHFSFACEYHDYECLSIDISKKDSLQSNEKSTLEGMLEKLVHSRSRMKSINLRANQFCEDIAGLHDVIMRYDFPKLTNMSNINLKLLPQHIVYDFLPRHSQLTFVKFNIKISRSKNGTILVGRLMNCLLDSCTQLQSLKMRVSKNLCLSDPNIFKKIKNSGLKSLALDFGMRVQNGDQNGSGITAINSTLKYLHLSGRHVNNNGKTDEAMTRAFIKTFRGLTGLVIDNPGLNDCLLQDIFCYQRQLTSLKLWSNESVSESQRPTDYGYTGIQENGRRSGYSIKDLQKLQTLLIHVTYTNVVFEELNLPNLTSLSLSKGLLPKLKSKDLLRTFSNLPNLEALFCAFKKDDIRCCTWLKICQQLKKLRFLELESFCTKFCDTEFTDQQCTLFFEKSPTLRILYICEINIFDQGIYRSHQFNFDTVLGKVRKAKESDELSTPSEILDLDSIGF